MSNYYLIQHFYIKIFVLSFISFIAIINGVERSHKHRTSTSTTTTTTTTSNYLDLWYKKDSDSPSTKREPKRNSSRTSTTKSSTTITTTRITTTTQKPISVWNNESTTTMATNDQSQKEQKVEVVAFCNDPGRPPRSQISPVQLTFMDGEQVVYTCDQFISLKQYRKCIKGKWYGDMPLCGEAFRDNDLVQVQIYTAENGFPTRTLSTYNLTNKLQPFNKFGNSFIAERYSHPVRASNSTDYYWHLFLAKPALIQMVRISFSVVNHLTDPRIRDNHFDVVSVSTNQYRTCSRVANHSVSPWHYNSTRFDFWYFCRAKSKQDFYKEISDMTNVVRVETTSQIMIKYDLATFILAEQYSNNENLSDPICGLPEVPVGLEAKVINDQSNYVFTCAKDFQRVDNYGGQFQVLQCDYDNRWHGNLPQCLPVRSCQKFHLENDADHNYLVEVFKYDRVFYVNETNWIPIRGSRAFFRCKDETNIFVGKEIRICDDGEWTNSLPNCLPTSTVKSDDSLKTSSILMIVLTTLIFTFLLSSCTIYFFLKLRNKNDQLFQQGMMIPGMELSDSASGYYLTPTKQIDEVYEVVDDHPHHNDTRYASYQDNILVPGQRQIYDYAAVISNQGDDYYDDSNVRPYLSMQRRT